MAQHVVVREYSPVWREKYEEEAEKIREIRRHLAVRDYLRTHREEAEAYGCLKERLAEEYPYDIEGYCDGKDEFVKELERRALAWALDR